MKKLVLTLLVIVSTLTIKGNTNETSKSESGTYEFTLGGSGSHIDGESSVGGDFSVSTNPFKSRPEVWLGFTQGLYWEPDFAASTDINAEWSFHLFKKLYANVGVFGGVLYNENTIETWRYGPSLVIQYYVTDSSFIYSGVTYDITTKGNDGWRYSFGLGLSW